MEKTIAAISTAIGNGGISIIRMSGKGALKIASTVFSCKENVENFKPRKMYLGNFNFKDISDKCMCVYFKAPNSYTGEDVVEFHCHGGMTLTNKIFESLVECGCTPATKGEFSKRAFLNGKLSLDEAEGIIDIINAESTSELKAGYTLLNGRLKNNIDALQGMLTTMLAKIEVTLDYPEEDLEQTTKSELLSNLHTIKNILENLLSTSKLGKIIKDGVRVLIFGKTNAGKSSILNSLLGMDRAIVTSVHGTTRDTLEETIEYKGYKFILIDSAGIRKSSDEVEKIGIKKSFDELNSADIVLFIIDGNQKLDEEDFANARQVSDKNTILVVNKCDLEQNAEIDKLPIKNKIFVSAKTGKNIETIKETLLKFVTNSVSSTPALVLTNTRHAECIKDALIDIDHAIYGLNNDTNLDLISIDLSGAWNSLGNITGTTDNEKIIEEIFDKFCVGK